MKKNKKQKHKDAKMGEIDTEFLTNNCHDVAKCAGFDRKKAALLAERPSAELKDEDSPFFLDEKSICGVVLAKPTKQNHRPVLLGCPTGSILTQLRMAHQDELDDWGQFLHFVLSRQLPSGSGWTRRRATHSSFPRTLLPGPGRRPRRQCCWC
eukprot:jgi/Bigna1/146254/aug1.111_g20962